MENGGRYVDVEGKVWVWTGGGYTDVAGTGIVWVGTVGVYVTQWMVRGRNWSGGTSYGNLSCHKWSPRTDCGCHSWSAPATVSPPRCGPIMAAIVSPGDHLWHESPP